MIVCGIDLSERMPGLVLVRIDEGKLGRTRKLLNQAAPQFPQGTSHKEITDGILVWVNQKVKYPVERCRSAPFTKKTVRPPCLVGVEFPIQGGHGNARTYGNHMALGGILEYRLQQGGYKIVRVHPSETKKALTGDGRAGKDEMVQAARQKYRGVGGNNKREREAIADAIGVAEAAYILRD